MEPKSLGDHQKLLTDVIKKQIVILGPDITLAKARNVAGLTIADDGTVTAMTGDPKVLTQQLVNQFMELSGMIVKKTMEPLLASSMDGDTNAKAAVAAVTAGPVTPTVTTPPPTPTTPPVPTTPPPSTTPPVTPPVTPPAPSTPTPPIANNNPDVKQSKQE